MLKYTTTRLELGKDSSGLPMISATEFDENGIGVRSYCISTCDKNIADSVMERRFEDLKKLMKDSVTFMVEPSWEIK